MNHKPLSITHHFADLTDPRIDRTRDHDLLDIVTISICAVIAGCDEWTAIAEYGRSQYDWFKTFLRLPNGIPTHDTFNRVFNRLDPSEFQRCFGTWIEALSAPLGLRHIPIDGKTLRRSSDRGKGKAALHLVSAWARENHLTLGQVAVAGKSNEITAIPELLKLLDIAGALVSIDAIGCQKEIVAQIREQGGDYLIPVKDNQPRLHEDVQACVARHLQANDLPESCYHFSEEEGHGRIEKRSCCVIENPDGIRDPELWRDLRVICQVTRERVVNGQYSIETHHYIGSRVLRAEELAGVIRGHWSIENQCHWTLDIAFGEDDCRCRTGHGPENLAWLRRVALGLLKQNTSCKAGTKTKRLKAGWDNDFLLEIISGAVPS